MKRTSWIAFSLALAGHASLFWLSFHEVTSQPPDTLAPVVVETIPQRQRQTQRGGTKGSGTRSARGGPKSADRLSFRDLGITPSRYGQVSIPDDTEMPEGMGEGGLRGTPMEGIQETVANNRWFEEIDSALHYPQEFLDNSIGGKVDAELFFEGGRTYIEARSRVRSNSPYLRVHVLRIVRSVFPEPVLWAREGKKDLILICEFKFDLSRSKASAVQQGIKPRMLVFYRYGKMPGEWKLGPLRGVGMMPAVGIDPNWFVEQITRKSDLDPLEKYRRDPAW